MILRKEGVSLTLRVQTCRAKSCPGMPSGDIAWMIKKKKTGAWLERWAGFQERRMTQQCFPHVSKNQRDREAWAALTTPTPSKKVKGFASFSCKPLRPDGLVRSGFGKR